MFRRTILMVSMDVSTNDQFSNLLLLALCTILILTNLTFLPVYHVTHQWKSRSFGVLQLLTLQPLLPWLCCQFQSIDSATKLALLGVGRGIGGRKGSATNTTLASHHHNLLCLLPPPNATTPSRRDTLTNQPLLFNDINFRPSFFTLYLPFPSFLPRSILVQGCGYKVGV